MPHKLHLGDCLDVLNKIDYKIDLTVTSPPYFNLRNYTNGHEKEIGLENDVETYINNLSAIFKRIYEITNKTGSCYVNISDTYGKNGSLLCVPDKLKLAMINIGWICRNEIIWHKPNAMPNSAKNRFTNDFEKVYFFVKDKNEYIFNTQYEERKSGLNVALSKEKKQSKYESDQQEKSVRQGMDKNRGNNLIEVRNNLPEQQHFVEFLRERTNPKVLSENSSVSKSTIDHWFRKDKGGFAYPKLEDWKLVREFIDDYSDDFNKIDFGLTELDYETDHINKNAHLGRIKRAVWSINTKASKEKHFASYPTQLITPMILSSSNELQIVLDPFMGSGTTGIACMNTNRKFLGIELNKDYYDMASKRLEEYKIQLSMFNNMQVKL